MQSTATTLGATQEEILQWESLAIKEALRLRPWSMDPEDARQEARFVMVKVASRFDRKRANFGTFVKRCVASHFLGIRRKDERLPDVLLLSDAMERMNWRLFATEPGEPGNAEQVEKLAAVLKTLKPTERHVVCRYHGIGMDQRAPSEIAREINRSKQRVFQILHAAHARVRQRLQAP